MNEVPNEARKNISWLENAAFYVVLGVMFLLPLFFIPALAAPFQFSKTALLFIGILVAFFLYVISRLEEGKVPILFNWILIAAWVLPVIYFISAFFSGNLRASLIGQGFNVDTFSFIFGGVLLMTLVPLVVKTKERILRIYTVLLFSFVVLVLFQVLRLFFGADFLSLGGIFNTSVSNLLGKWNDLAIFFGLTTILSLVTLEGLQLNNQSRIILYASLAASLFFLAVINFFPVWLVVGLFALGFFVYGISKSTLAGWRQGALQSENEEGAAPAGQGGKVSFAALSVLIITLVFVLFGNSVGNILSSSFNVTQLEARPSWQSTVEIGKQTYKEDNFLFGSGPNTFSKQWVKFKPQDINNTLFWNVDFSAGIGHVPTAFITAGALGGVAWIVFLGLLLWTGLRALILRPVEDSYVYYLMLSSFLSSVYLWILAVLYIPGTVILALAFFFTGIFITTLRYRDNTYTERTIVFGANPRLGFVAVLFLTVFLILDAVGLYIVGQQYASAFYFQRSVYSFNVEGSLDGADKNLTQAIQLARTDRNLRLASEIGLARLNETFSRTDLDLEDQRNQFQTIFSNTIQSAQAATNIDPNNYQNWMSLGRVYGVVVPLQIEGAYENAKRSYDRVLELNPHSPLVFLTLAQLELARGNIGEAKTLLDRALEKKSNYTEAIFLLAQIQIQEGDLENAIKSVEAATILNPSNSVLFFQLGLLHYNTGDDARTINALEQAVNLNSVYSNARYFLGLSYFRTGRNEEAIEQFERIAALNPDNEEVKQILRNLRAGNDPFAAVSDSVEDLDTLPIQ